MKFLTYANTKSYSLAKGGFTLLELLIVVLMMGILTTIALPVLFRQVGKAREAEAKQGLSAIAFSQQAYHFEHRGFADSYADMGLSVSDVYYSFSAPDTDGGRTISDSTPKNLGNDPYRTYSIGVYYDSGIFNVVLCQSSSPITVTKAPDSFGGACSNDGTKIQ